MKLKRRDFIKLITGITTLSSPFSSIISPFTKIASAVNQVETKPGKGIVIIVKRPEVITSNGAVSSEIISHMLNEGVCSLTGIKSQSDAWKSLFLPTDRIGIKINALGGKEICTHPELAYAVSEQLVKNGTPPGNIIIWDRQTTELKKAGYRIERAGSSVRCFGTDYDYESTPEYSGSIGSCFSRILTQGCDAVISIPVLKDHDLAGVSLNLKNFFGVIHNPNKYHDNGCDPFIADLNNHPYIKNKLRLVIIDGLNGQYSGGPSFKPSWSWPFRGLLFSRDPVAIDIAGTQIIERQRKLKGLPSLKENNRHPKHIETAAKLNLGAGDINTINIKVIQSS
jgi:uncharacterized protein (DUF362 family)